MNRLSGLRPLTLLKFYWGRGGNDPLSTMSGLAEARKSAEGEITCEGGFNQCAFDIARRCPDKGTPAAAKAKISRRRKGPVRVLRVCLSPPTYRRASAITPRSIEFTRTRPSLPPLPSIGRFGLFFRMEFNFTWKHDRPRLCCFASGSALLSERTREESEASARCNKVPIGGGECDPHPSRGAGRNTGHQLQLVSN